MLDSPLLVALAVLCTVVLAGACGFAAALWKVSNAPHPEVKRLTEAFRAEAEEARAADRRQFAAALEEAADIAETVKRHRRRIDGAKRTEPGEDQEQPQLPMSRDEQRANLMRLARARRGA